MQLKKDKETDVVQIILSENDFSTLKTDGGLKRRLVKVDENTHFVLDLMTEEEYYRIEENYERYKTNRLAHKGASNMI